METETTKIATSFVDLALKYHDWSNIKELPEDEAQILLATVSAAGFNSTLKIVFGRPKSVISVYYGCCKDWDDKYKNVGEEIYATNKYYPFRMINQDDSVHYYAMGWLNEVIRLAKEEFDDYQKRIEAIQQEIERSVPLKPIQLTSEGDMLQEYPPSREFHFLVDHTRDEIKMSECVGVHGICRGRMDYRRSTESHYIIVCQRCYLRVLLPKEIKTYGCLRKHMESKFAQVSA